MRVVSGAEGWVFENEVGFVEFFEACGGFGIFVIVGVP